MKIPNKLRKLIESFLLALIPFALNLLFPTNPGFVAWLGLPYLLTGILFTGFYGWLWGAWEILLSLSTGFLILPLILSVISADWVPHLLLSLQFTGPLSFLAYLAAGFTHTRQRQYRHEFLARLRRSIHEQRAIRSKANSLERVNRILENRVINQKDSITLLRSQVRKLASLNIEQALSTLLETIHLFTDMRSGSIWTNSKDGISLSTVASFGWNEEVSRPHQVGLEDSVEGYVFRNGKPFSVRMAMGTQEFARLDYEYNILTLPIRVRSRVWGVLNIEDLPFERYSLYTESVLEILLSLVEPYLSDILDHEALFELREVDEDTGLPQATQLYRTLEREIEHRGQSGSEISLIVIEMSNFDHLLIDCPRAELKRLFPRIKTEFDASHNMKSRAFQFKNDNQMAMVLTGLGQDGTSFLCLDLLSTIPGMNLEINGKTVPLEMIVGFSTSHDTNSGEAMIAIAENLLEMQRL